MEENVLNNKERFIGICKQTISRAGINELLEWMESTDFYVAPASTRYHGAYEGGLLQHSLNVYDQLQVLLKAYPEIECSPETAAIISLFHDLTKTNMYDTEKRNRKNELGKWETYDAYVVNEKLKYGSHGGKSVFLICQFMKLTFEEAIAIQNHMGAYDNEYVGAVYEVNKLAWLLHVADEAATYIMETKERG